MLAVGVDALTMDTRGRNAPGGVATSPETARAASLFDQFLSAGTFKSVLFTYRQLCEVLRLKPTNISAFYPRLKAKLHSWKAASLWAKLDKRASHKCYNRGKACPNTRVLIIGAGPCGLRAAIEAQLLGAKVVVIEKRDRFSRNNVLHLWPFVIHDLRSLGAKKFFGKFCAGSIDHISIRQLQIVLLKVSLLLGIEVHENVGFGGLVEPPDDQTNERIGWRASVLPSDHPVSQYEFDVLVGADGKRNTLLGFNRKEFRGKLAIAVTANFINRHTLEEARVLEISGVAFIFNQKFFQDMREQTGIDLENIVYYKDDTHYFVMTAKKHSLLDRGVIINDFNDTARLLAAENVDREALMEYARDAADFATSYQLPNLDFAVNHYGQADVAMFDFTSMYAAENACRIMERKGHRLLQGLVGDSLLEPFWPTGSGCARGFLSSFDVGWMIRSWSSGKMTQLQVLAERESIYRLLAQTTPENLSKDMNQYTLNPSSRYPNLNVHAVLPSQVRSLYDTDGNIEDQIIDVAVEAPKKKRRRESIIHPDTLLNWCQRQVALHDNLKIENLTSSWKNGLALCTILHRYRPDLIDLSTLQPENITKNNQLAFDICERELGIPPVMTGQEMADCDVPDKLSMVSYISQIYECFRGEIPVVSSKITIGDEQSISPSRHGTPFSLLTKISHKFQNKRKYSIEREANKEKADNVQKRSRNSSTLINKRRSKERDKGIALDLVSKDVSLTNFKSISPNAPKQSINSRVKNLEEKMKRDAGLRCHISNKVEGSKGLVPSLRAEHSELSIKHIQEQLQKNGSEVSAKKVSGLKVGKLRKDEWNVKMLEEKIKQQQKSLQKSSGAEKSKILKSIFDDKLRLIDAKLKAGGTLTAEEQTRFEKFDSCLNKLKEQLTKGNLETGERGHNQVAAMTEHMTSIWDKKTVCKKDPLPPPPVISSSSRSEPQQMGGSEICYFCKKRVYLVEHLSAEGLFFHRICFKCEYCGGSLRLGNYSFDRDAVCGGKFYCSSHFRMQKPDHRWQEMMKRKQAFLSCTFDQQEKEKMYTTVLANAEKALSPNKQLNNEPINVTDSTKSPTVVESKEVFSAPLIENKTPNLLSEPIVGTSGRDQTPERVEYENSILELSEEELLTSELEEEELTQKNFGPCQDLATSDDEFSDLSTDTESDEEAFAEELERSLTADETRKLAQTWQRRYSAEHSLIESDASSSADDEGSDTEIGSDDGTSEDVDSDAEYSLENSKEGLSAENEKPLEEIQVLKTLETKEDLVVEVPIIDLKGLRHASEEDLETDSDLSDEVSESDECSDESTTEVDSESEPEVPLPPPQIPTIIIEESPPQDIDQELDWGEISKEVTGAEVDSNDAPGTPVQTLRDGIESAVENYVKILDRSDEFAEKSQSVSNETYIPPPDPVVESLELISHSSAQNLSSGVNHIPSTPLVLPFLTSCDEKNNSLFQSECDKNGTFPNEIETKSIVEDNVNLKKKVYQESAMNAEDVYKLNLSEINSAAKEIVCDVLKTAQKSVSCREDSTLFMPFNTDFSQITVNHIVPDLSPCTEDTSSTTESVGWAELKSSHSSGDSEVPLMQELVSPMETKKELPSESNLASQNVHDLHNQPMEVTGDKYSCESDQNNFLVQDIPQGTRFPDYSSLPKSMCKTKHVDVCFQDNTVIPNTENMTLQNECLLGVQNIEPTDRNETVELVGASNSLNVTDPFHESTLMEDSFNFNPSFVTIRKKKKNPKNDSFHWDSDNSISLPFFGDEDNDCMSVDVGKNTSILSEDGVYRATLVHSIDGDYPSEEENASGSVGLVYESEDVCPVQGAISSNELSSVLIKEKASEIIDSVPSLLHKLNQDEKKCIEPKSELLTSPSLSFVQQQELCDIDGIKNLPMSPSSTEAQTSHPICIAPEHSVDSINFKTSSKNQDFIKTKSDVNSTNTFASSFSDSKLLLFRPNAELPSGENRSKSNEISSVMKKSADLSDDKANLIQEKSHKTKYHGYSGSFAEKVRPKSLFGDTIYLRSLDINLQKQQFPSLAKGTDKLIDSDISFTEPNEYYPANNYCDVKRKLFDSAEKSNVEILVSPPIKECVDQSHSAQLTASEVVSKANTPNVGLLISKPQLAMSVARPQDGMGKVNSDRHRHSSAKTTVSFVTQEAHSDPISPYTYAQTRSIVENAFPVKMQPKAEMDVAKLRQKREKRKSVHEDIQGLLFADDEKQLSPIEPLAPSEDVFERLDATTNDGSEQQIQRLGNRDDCSSSSHTPDFKDQDEYLRLHCSVDQEKARKEARARARLKSDEELGLSPNNYRKKYHRQLSLNSIHYEELYTDEFFDHDDEELEDEILDGMFPAKRVEIVEQVEVIPDIVENMTMKRSPQSSEESNRSNVSTSQESTVHTSNKTISVTTSDSTSKTDAANYLESPLVVEDEDFSILHSKLDFLGSSLPFNRTSSSETSPEVHGNEAPQFDINQKNRPRVKQSHRTESSGDEDKVKGSGKKSFFAILNFGKSAAFKEKLSKLPVSKDMDKERSSSLPADLSGKIPPKHKPFSHLKLPKPKEKFRDKPSRKTHLLTANDSPCTENIRTEKVTPPPQEQSVQPNIKLPSISHSKVVPKYMVYRTPGTRLSIYPPALPLQKVENGMAPKASEDSFSDTEDDTQGSRGQSSISTLEKRDRSAAEKERKAQRMVMKVQRQQELKRLRTAQEIQRRLEELEIQQKELEQQGVEMEKALRGEVQGSWSMKSESELMQQWYSLLRSKHRLRKEEQELSIRMKDLELEDRHSRLQQEMRIRMAQNHTLKNPSQIGEERKILSEMLRIVEERDELVAMLEQLRVREQEEDKNLGSQMLVKGIDLSAEKT